MTRSKLFVGKGRALAVAVALTIGIVTGGGCGHARKQATEDVERLRQAALADLKKGKPQDARKGLLEAVRVGKANAIDDEVLARTHVTLGAVYAGPLKESDKAVAHMAAALDRDPNVKLEGATATASAKRALAAAKRAAAKAAKGEAAGVSKTAKADVQAPELKEPKAKTPPKPESETAPEPVPAAVAAAPPDPPPVAVSEAPAAESAPATALPSTASVDELLAAAEAATPKADAPAPRKVVRKARPPARRRAFVKRRRGRYARIAPARAGRPAPRTAAAVRRPPPPVAEPMPPPAPPPPPTSAEVAMAVPPPRQLPDALTCQGPDEAPPENEVLLRCAVKAGIKVSKVSLHYRPAGSETFTEITMPRNKKGWYTGVLPASATEGKSLQYFVEGAGPNKISSGTSESPNLILVREGARPAGPDDPLPDGSEEEDEDEDERPSSVNEDPLAAVAMQRAIERDRVGAHRREAGQMFVALGLGTGFGWQPGGVLEFRKDREVAAGPLSGGLGHVLPEFGYQLNEDFALSLQGRVQFIPTQGSGDATVGTPAERAIAVLVRAVYAFGSGNLRGFASVAAGAGEGFRLKVPPDPAVRLVRSDTVKGGPLVGGVGLGFAYHFNRHVAWSTEARALVGAPTIAAIGEISSGLELGF